MDILTRAGLDVLLRFGHIISGITWIGLLYYFNFIQGAFFAGTTPEVRTTATRELAPRALWWFRWAALFTVIFGLAVIISIAEAAPELGNFLTSNYFLSIGTGMVLGITMMLNVWGVIWPNQKIVIASAESVAAGGEADPRAADAGRRALLASRTNVLFSVPMLFFMIGSSRLAAGQASAGARWTYAIVAAAIVAVCEANALAGLTGKAKRYLETVPNVIVSGFVLLVVFYILMELTILS